MQGDLATHALDDFRCNSKTETRSAMPARKRIVALLEFPENACARLLANAGAAVLDRETDFIAVMFDDDKHAAFVSEFHRIARKIEKHLAQFRRIAEDPCRNAVGNFSSDLDAFGLCARREQFDYIRHK